MFQEQLNGTVGVVREDIWREPQCEENLQSLDILLPGNSGQVTMPRTDPVPHWA